MSGTEPGTDLFGLHLPLNIDGLTTGISFVAGFLDGGGNGASMMPIGGGPLPPSVVGITLSSSAAIVNGSGVLTDFTDDENVRFGL